MLRLVLAFVLFIPWLLLAAAPVAAAELVVDNADASVRRTGDWAVSSATPGFIGGDYLFHVAGSGASSVFWPFPEASPGGRYDVFARWTSGPNRASNAAYAISFAGGSTSLSVDQRQGGGTWQPLGTFAFVPGQGLGVTLSDNADGVVIADAVRFVGPQSADAAPVAAATPTATAAPAAATPTAGPTATASAADAAATDVSPAAVAGAPTTSPPSAVTAGGGPWTVTLQAAQLHAGPDQATDAFGTVPQFSYLQVLGYQGDWAYVFNPRTRGTAYVPSSLLGPSDPPPTWVTADPPPVEALDQVGRSVGAAPLAYYPVDDPFAYTSKLGHNVSIRVTGRVLGADGSTWYRTDQGFLQSKSVRLPRPPDRMLSGRWLDADLREPALLTAYDGSRLILTTLAIKGTIANQTPTGTFTIGRWPTRRWTAAHWVSTPTGQAATTSSTCCTRSTSPPTGRAFTTTTGAATGATPAPTAAWACRWPRARSCGTGPTSARRS